MASYKYCDIEEDEFYWQAGKNKYHLFKQQRWSDNPVCGTYTNKSQANTRTLETCKGCQTFIDGLLRQYTEKNDSTAEDFIDHMVELAGDLADNVDSDRETMERKARKMLPLRCGMDS